MSIEGQGHFFIIYIFQVLYVLCFTRSRYQVSVYRTIGPQVTDLVGMETFGTSIWRIILFILLKII